MAGKKWEKPPGQEDFIVKCVTDENLHPADIVPLFEEKFGFYRSENSINKRLATLGISYDHCTPKGKEKERARIISNPAPEVRRDVKYHNAVAELQTMRAKYDEAIKGLSFQEKLIDTMKSCVAALPPVKVRPATVSENTEITSETGVLLLSDFHAGEKVMGEAVMGLNEYNFDIMCERLRYLSDKVLDISEHKLAGYDLRKLAIFILGDMVTGEIHDELAETNEMDVVQVTICLAYVLAQFVQEMASYYREIEISAVVGNHGRTQKQVKFKNRHVNWDYLCYQYLSMFLGNQPNVKMNIPKSFFTLHKVEGKVFLLLHGDNIRSWQGIPFYGILRSITQLRKLLNAKNKKFDYVCLAHFHNSGEIDDVGNRLILNGSLKGMDEYSIGRLFTGSNANQSFFGVHRKQKSWHYDLNLQDIPKITNPYKYKLELDEGVKPLNAR